MANKDYYKERITFYASKIISEELVSGDEYSKMRKVIIISILNFDLYNYDTYRKESIIVDKTYKDLVLLDNPEFIFIELPKFRKKIIITK